MPSMRSVARHSKQVVNIAVAFAVSRSRARKNGARSGLSRGRVRDGIKSAPSSFAVGVLLRDGRRGGGGRCSTGRWRAHRRRRSRQTQRRIAAFHSGARTVRRETGAQLLLAAFKLSSISDAHDDRASGSAPAFANRPTRCRRSALASAAASSATASQSCADSILRTPPAAAAQCGSCLDFGLRKMIQSGTSASSFLPAEPLVVRLDLVRGEEDGLPAEEGDIVDAAVTRSRPSVCRRTSSELCPNEEEV